MSVVSTPQADEPDGVAAGPLKVRIAGADEEEPVEWVRARRRRFALNNGQGGVAWHRHTATGMPRCTSD